MRLASPEQVFDDMKHVFDRIASRAYQIFESNGRQPGSDLQNWYRAEAELLCPVQVDIFDSQDTLTLRTEVPGFRADELQIGLEPGRFTIAGTRRTPGNRRQKQADSADRGWNHVFHSAPLPHEVDPAHAKATLVAGVLRLQLTKAAAGKQGAARAAAAAS
ncbi:MAG TPA: DUF2934 domain-containing protein [Candidatus Acidoferrales bacterium]|nr:DUF2934 domain-containing protein [Candidatus Acidoferrales bacterium]